MLCRVRVGELVPHLTRSQWAEAYLCTKWHLDPFSRLAMGRKLGEDAVSIFLGGKAGAHLTQ